MTTFDSQSVACGACGRVFTHPTWVMTSSSGSPDLDNRQSEMDSMMLQTVIQRCPGCGFCSGNVRRFDPRYRAVLDSAPYRSQLADSQYPPLATAFICAAMLDEAVGRGRTAGLNQLGAAWVLEDASQLELARLWRRKAADTLLAVLSAGELDEPQPGLTEAIVADCLRRSGRGPEALQVIERALRQPHGELIPRVLRFQRLLIQRGDTARHGIDEAMPVDDSSV